MPRFGMPCGPRARRGTKPPVRPLATALALVAGLCASASADEREWILSLQPGAAMIHVPDRGDAWGAGGGLDLTYGINDALALRLTGAYTAHALDPQKDKDNNILMPGGLTQAWFA